MTASLLPRRELRDVLKQMSTVIPPGISEEVRVIVERVRTRGEIAIREYATRFGERTADQPLYLGRDDLRRALEAMAPPDRERLERIGNRIRDFAVAQRGTLAALERCVPGGKAGHRIDPVDAAGCYAPGGRYPLPSSVLMTAITARVAGVDSVWVASPKPAPITLAAAAVADVDGLLAVGGAHAIAGLAFGVGPVPASNVVVGPGNLYVTAAKQLLSGAVAIDMLAGPSELVIIADGLADPARIAADLLAQAEHDPDAVPILVTTAPALTGAVEKELDAQLSDLPTADVARAALSKGGVIACTDTEEAVRVSDAIAPEHLQLAVANADDLVPRLNHYGALFIGANSAEVFADYGLGPNHVLPTSGTARARGGLSVMDFMRVRTWLRLEKSEVDGGLVEDAAWLARQEGLEAHARSAELRGK